MLKIKKIIRKFCLFKSISALNNLDSQNIGTLCHKSYIKYRLKASDDKITETILKNNLNNEDFKNYLQVKNNFSILGKKLFDQISDPESSESFILQKIKDFLNFFIKISYISENINNPFLIDYFFKIEKIYREILLKDNNINKKTIFFTTKVFFDIICINLIKSQNQQEILDLIHIHFKIAHEKNHLIYISIINRIIRYTENQKIKEIFNKNFIKYCDFSIYDINNTIFLENQENIIIDFLRVFNHLEFIEDNNFIKTFENFFFKNFSKLLLNEKIKLNLEIYSRIIKVFGNYFNDKFMISEKKNFLYKIRLKMLQNINITNCSELFLFLISISAVQKYNSFYLERDLKIKIFNLFKNEKYFQKFKKQKGYNIAFYNFLNFVIEMKKDFYQNQKIINMYIKHYLEQKPIIDVFVNHKILLNCDKYIENFYAKSSSETKNTFFLLIKYIFENIFFHKNNEVKNMTKTILNKIARIYFIFKNTKNYQNLIIEEKFLKEYSKIDSLEHFIFAVQFWIYWITLNHEYIVSSQSKNLSVFLFQVNIQNLLDKFFLENLDEFNLTRFLQNINGIYREFIYAPEYRDKKSIYRVKPMKRVYETMYLKLGEKFLEDENLLKLLSKSQKGVKIIFNTFAIMNLVYSNYNLKTNGKYNDLLFNIYIKKKDYFKDHLLLEKYLNILQLQNFSSSIDDKLLSSLLNKYLISISIKLKQNNFYFNSINIFFNKNIIFDLEDVNYDICFEPIMKILLRESSENYFYDGLIQKIRFLLKFSYKFQENEIQKLLDNLLFNFEEKYSEYIKLQNEFNKKFSKNNFIIFFKYCGLKINNQKSKNRSEEIIKFLEKIPIIRSNFNKEGSKSNSHLQLEAALKRLKIKYETEIEMIFGRADFLINDVIIELNGNVHFRKNKIDLNLLLKRKIAKMFGYKIIFINDMQFVLSKDKKEFIKKVFKFYKIEV